MFSSNIAFLCPWDGKSDNDCHIGKIWFYILFMEMVCTFIFVTLILHIKKINGSAKEDILNAASVALALSFLCVGCNRRE